MPKKPHKDMAKELERYKDDVYLLNKSGKLVKIILNSLNDYNHNKCELHHYIQYHSFIQNPEWYEERGIKQKLILVSKICHEHIENRAIRNLTDAEFEQHYKISRYELIFNKKKSNF